MPRVISVIQHEDKRGAGIKADPVRIVMQYFAPNGELLAEHDAWMIENFNGIMQAIKDRDNPVKPGESK